MNSVLTIEENGKLTLPNDIVERYQFKRESQFRIIETQKGVLLIPLTDEPMNNKLKAELNEWQTIGADATVSTRNFVSPVVLESLSAFDTTFVETISFSAKPVAG
jgi:bifunctional DNA-binding transcriptional regulator/antitoxin component of YhaV-PrlF toxin-antitoxin module